MTNKGKSYQLILKRRLLTNTLCGSTDLEMVSERAKWFAKETCSAVRFSRRRMTGEMHVTWRSSSSVQIGIAVTYSAKLHDSLEVGSGSETTRACHVLTRITSAWH